MNFLKIVLLAASLFVGTNAAFAGETYCEISGGKAQGYYCTDTVEVVVGADATITQLNDRGRVVESDTSLISFSLSNRCKLVVEEDLDRNARFCRFVLVID